MSLWGIDDSLWQPLEASYWASRPTAVQALRALQPSSPERESLARGLALKGYTIDVPIDVWGWVVYNTMLLRQQFGYTWVPSALQPALSSTPGNNLPGQVPYDPANPPAGSIKVSLNLADYPPYQDAVQPEQPEVTNVVGAFEFDDVYTFGPGALVNGQLIIQNGQKVKQAGKVYLAHRSTGLMGDSLYFTLVA